MNSKPKISYLKEKNLKRIAINVPKDIRAKIRAACEAENITMSDWVRKAILRQIYEFEMKK